MRVISDNAEAEQLLSAMAQLVVEGGGFIDPALDLVCKNDALSVNLNRPSSFGAAMAVRVPEHLLVPSKPLNPRIENDKLIITPDAVQLSRAQIELAQHVVRLFNATDKLNTHLLEFPCLAYRRAPDLLDRLLRSRSNIGATIHWRDCVYGKFDSSEEKAFCLDSFLHTRLLGMRDKGGARSFDVLMPIIDCFNHDPRGTSYDMSSLGSAGRHLSVKGYQAEGGSSECFVNYGHVDSVDAFLCYGYAPPVATFVRSVPLNLDISGVGRVRVLSIPKAPNSPTDFPSMLELRQFAPAVQRDSTGRVILSSLFIPVNRPADSFTRVLSSIVRKLGGDGLPSHFVDTEARKLEQQIITANRLFFEELREFCEGSTDSPDELRQRIIALSQMQLGFLAGYS